MALLDLPGSRDAEIQCQQGDRHPKDAIAECFQTRGFHAGWSPGATSMYGIAGTVRAIDAGRQIDRVLLVHVFHARRGASCTAQRIIDTISEARFTES